MIGERLLSRLSPDLRQRIAPKVQLLGMLIFGGAVGWFWHAWLHGSWSDFFVSVCILVPAFPLLIALVSLGHNLAQCTSSQASCVESAIDEPGSDSVAPETDREHEIEDCGLSGWAQHAMGALVLVFAFVFLMVASKVRGLSEEPTVKHNAVVLFVFGALGAIITRRYLRAESLRWIDVVVTSFAFAALLTTCVVLIGMS